MQIRDAKVLVCGAGGFIGGHLVNSLFTAGAASVRAVDIKSLEECHQLNPAAENKVLDLELIENCRQASQGVEAVFQLAADMGGMGFIENNKTLCMLNVLSNTHMLLAAASMRSKYGRRQPDAQLYVHRRLHQRDYRYL